MSIDLILYLVAFVFFLIEAAPISKGGWSFMNLSFACLTLSLIV